MIFQDRQLPERATLAGYSDLIDTFLVCGFHWREPCSLRVCGTRFWSKEAGACLPHATPYTEGTLDFRFKCEGFDLAVLKHLFLAVDATEIKSIVRTTPTSVYSRRLLPLIEWEPVKCRNVQALNDTANFYRFFNATPHAELLIECVRRTIEEDLPNETDFLRRYDRFTGSLQAIADIPGRTSNLVFRFLRQIGGCLSRQARDGEFKELTDEENRKNRAFLFRNF